MTALKQQQLSHLTLFNLPAFSALSGDGRRYERIDLEHDGRFVGTLAGVLVEDTFVSGYGASFGGMDFVRERETLDVVMNAVERAVERIRTFGVTKIRIRAKPFHYSSNEEYLHFSLLRNGFVVDDVNLNFVVDLTRVDDVEAYRRSLRHAAERQLRIALTAEYDWREATAGDDWDAGYEVLVESRRRNDAVLSLSFDDVIRMRDTFRERVRLFLLENAGQCVAAALLYGVAQRHAMVMFWGDREDRALRQTGDRPPVAVMNLLAYRTIETALAGGFRSLDLGTASTNDRVNFGNARFKSSINAIPNFRYTLTRTLDPLR